MDREFLARWMPKTDALFSYRIIDASSFREAGLRLDRERTKSRLDLVAKYGGHPLTALSRTCTTLRTCCAYSMTEPPIPLGA